MRIPLPFPKCKSCGQASSQSFHRNCGGRMYVEVTTDEVYCDKCTKHWNAWDSTYYCTCGSAFEATDVRTALSEVLACCKVCAEEIAAQEAAQKRRESLSEVSLRSFLSSFFERIGYAFGVAIGAIIEAVTTYILKK